MTEHEIEALETSVFGREGRWILSHRNVRLFYLVVEEVIGASLGEETTLVQVKWDMVGTFHGQPVAERELVHTLNRHNKAELAFFRSRN